MKTAVVATLLLVVGLGEALPKSKSGGTRRNVREESGYDYPPPSNPFSVTDVVDQEVTTKAVEQETLFSIEGLTTEAAAPKKVNKPVAVAQPADDDDEDDSASWPFIGAGRAGVPNYNAFFPIYFGSSGLRTRSAEGSDGSGSATAIANAFSTGKGGVANSHATSFGDPSAAAMLRNSGFFRANKGNKRVVLFPEDDE